jgi:hypothetical protein
MTTRRNDSVAVFLSVAALLIVFTHGDVGWRDAGHFTASAAGLGVPHPTGFPVYIVLGHLFSLLPVGSIAFRVALLSALSIAGATALIYATASRHAERPWLALLGSLSFPVTFTVWLNGTLAEVYALTALFIAALCHLLLRDKPSWRMAAFVTGLGLGVHITFALAAFVLWLITLTVHRGWGRVGKWIAWGLPGAAVLGVLPLLAAGDPWMNWGDATTLEGWWRHVTAAGITESFAGEIGTQAGQVDTHTVLWLQRIGGPWVPLALLCGVLGWVAQGRRWMWWAAMGLLISDGLFSVFANPMGQMDFQTGVPGALALSLMVALIPWKSPKSGWSRGWPMLCCTLTAILLVTKITERPTDLIPDQGAGAVSRAMLTSAEPDATAWLTGDDLPSQFYYLQGVEQMRLDVMGLVTPHLVDSNGLQRRFAQFQRLKAPLPVQLTEGSLSARAMAAVKGDLAKRPVYWMYGEGRLDSLMRTSVVEGPIFYRIAASRADYQNASRDGPEALKKFMVMLDLSGRQGFRTRHFFSEVARLAGIQAILASEAARRMPPSASRKEMAIKGALGDAASWLTLAVDTDGGNARSLVALAALYWRQGKTVLARDQVNRALVLDPTYGKAREVLQSYQGANPYVSTDELR